MLVVKGYGVVGTAELTSNVAVVAGIHELAEEVDMMGMRKRSDLSRKQSQVWNGAGSDYDYYEGRMAHGVRVQALVAH